MFHGSHKAHRSVLRILYRDNPIVLICARDGSIILKHIRQGYRFDNDWSQEELEEIHEEIVSTATIPVDVEIKGEHKVYNFHEVEAILRDADLIVLQDCRCRSARRNCGAPLHTCIFLNERAKSRLNSASRIEKNARKASLEEALEALRMSYDAGLVLMAYTREEEIKPTTICNCCSCCCQTLSALLRYGMAPAVLKSNNISEVRSESCINCMKCVDRCHFGARSIVDEKMFYDASKCFGCGLCVNTCPTQAIRLVERKQHLGQ
jgi:Pyruvate/2-oxoacid:ferredoxin oxidoreductase delta subunit